MATHSWYVPALFIVLLVVILYSFLFLYQTQMNWFLVILLLWAALLPVISDFPYGNTYFFSIPAPFFGTFYILLMIFEKYVELSVAWYLLAVSLSCVFVIVFHIKTRKRTMFGRLSMYSLSRISIATAYILFLMLAMLVLNPSILAANPLIEFFFLGAGIFGYIATSMLYANSSYRRFVLSNRIKRSNIEKFMSEKWAKIEKKFSSDQKDVDILRYYFNESFTSFLEGNFEKSFMWGYMVIREKTVVNPMEFVDDKRNGKPSFAEIRTTLQHSRRGDIPIDTKKIGKVLKNLFDDALDLLEREISFIEKCAE